MENRGVKNLNGKESTIINYAYDTSVVLGHGSFALVYKGRRMTEPFDEVAIKCVAKSKAAKSRSLISKEIKILKDLSKLKHENIVALHECHETPLHVYIIMEYCYGGDLHDYILANKKPLPESTLKLFVKQLARGMRMCYMNGIAHRDLKPQNILLDVKGHRYPPPSEITLKIADFGFARFIGDGAMAETLCGSPMYMAPEVLMSLKYTSAVDLFSLGTILYQCFTGNPPFFAKSPHELKEFYERKRGNWKVEFPERCAEATELRNLLISLLKVDYNRISYDELFSHPFVNLEPFEEEMKRLRIISDIPSNLMNKSPAETFTTSSTGMQRTAKPGRPYTGALPTTPEELEHQSRRPSDYSPKPAHRHNANTLTKTLRYADIARPSEPVRPESGTPLEEIDDFIIVPRNIPSDNDPARTKPYLVRTTTPVHHRRISTTSPVHQKLLRAASAPHQVHGLEGRFLQGGNANSTCTGGPDCMCDSCQGSFCLSFNDSGSSSASGKSSGLTGGNSNSSIRDVSESAPSRKVSDIMIPDVASMSPPAVQFCLTSPAPKVRRKSSSGNSATGQRYSPTGSPLHVSDIKSPAYFLPQHLYGYHGLPPVLPTAHRMESAPDDNGGKDICGNISEARDRVSCSASNRIDSSEIFLENFCKEGQINMSVGSSIVQRSTIEPVLQTNLSPTNMSDSAKQLMQYLTSAHEALLSGSGGITLPVSKALGMNTASYYAAPLCQETLMEKEHTETLTKLHFVLALIDCIFELAKSRSFFYTSPSIVPRREAIFGGEFLQNEEWQRKTEQLVLYVRALQLLSSAISMAQSETEESRLKSSNAVEEATRVLTDNFNYCYNICRDLNRSGQVMNMDEDTCAKVADKLIYYYSLDMCQNAAVNELFGKPEDSFKRYQTAQILLHALSQQVPEDDDKRIISVYQKAVEKRLFILHNQGVVQAVRTTDDL